MDIKLVAAGFLVAVAFIAWVAPPAERDAAVLAQCALAVVMLWVFRKGIRWN